MKTVGILNFHCADNFGAVLQAYALQRVILDLGYRAELIDFRPDELIMPYVGRRDFSKLRKKRGVLRAVKALVWGLPNQRKRTTRERLFAEMRTRNMIVSRQKYFAAEELTKNPPAYDAYISGSDQVWNPSFKKWIGNSYFLDFVEDESLKISYAASIAEPVPTELVEEYVNLINRFDFVSVREHSAKEFLEHLIDKKIEVTLDPTLLLNETEWAKLMMDHPMRSKYILVYDLAKSEKLTQVANKISSSTGFPVVSYSKSKNFNNGCYSFAYSSPGEFLSLVKDAELVLSSSFHGVAFSILFSKPFLAFAFNKRSSRIIDLLELLELKDRIMNETSPIERILNSSIDYGKTKERLEVRKEKSIEFLKNALGALEDRRK